jgi:succinate dehydrogenase / fumarate reductase iron-sulfur subunit
MPRPSVHPNGPKRHQSSRGRGARVSHLNLLPQGQPERYDRALSMVEAMEQEGFGACSNYAACEAVCPKGISIDFMAKMNRDYFKAKSKGELKVPLKT